ncbi:MAG: hypothetical protein FWB76_06940 [Oscillospiraceae bacterium]|nr:hypothetical protein [Oscillospiraceae bacterium]
MSAREKFLNEIHAMPEDDIINMMVMWNNYRQMLEFERARASQPQQVSSWDVLRKYCGSINRDINMKEELAQYHEEKYASLD